VTLTDGTDSYVYGPDGSPIEQIDQSGTPSYLHHDQLGSTRLITDQNGNAAGSFTYSPYGTLTASTGTASTPFGYAGQYTDPETGFQYDRARYYDPGTGQFLTRDPLAELTGESYSYAGDNPVNATDPSGLLCAFGYCLGFHPMAALDALVNIGRGASFGLSDTIANWISPGASCTVPQNSLDQFLGSTGTSLLASAALGKLGTGFFGLAAPEGDAALSASDQKAIQSLEQRIADHQAKLAAYEANPEAYDNLGILRDAPSDAVRQSIIAGRVRHLESEIDAFKQAIDRIRGGA
jgi:RHS repeat-associated protein